MVLHYDFVIYACLLIGLLIPLYVYRKKIFTYTKGNTNFNLFIKDLRLYLSSNHPFIKFNFSIIDKTENEQDNKIRQTIIVENIISQFIDYPYKKTTQSSVSKDKLWTGYEEKSKSTAKLPTDWRQRKELAWARDEHKCNRCGNKINLNNAHTQFAKSIEFDGGYNLENIIILCPDCNIILNSKNPHKNKDSLRIGDKLMLIVD